MAVTPENIAVALGRTAPAVDSTEYAQWEMWVSDALMLISARLVGDGTGQVASLDDLDQAKLDYVVREAVVGGSGRRQRRPDPRLPHQTCARAEARASARGERLTTTAETKRLTR